MPGPEAAAGRHVYEGHVYEVMSLERLHKWLWRGSGEALTMLESQGEKGREPGEDLGAEGGLALSHLEVFTSGGVIEVEAHG